MKKYLWCAVVVLFVAALIFRSTYPMAWHAYVLEQTMVANPFFIGETNERGYAAEMEVLDVTERYALCAVSSRITEVSKYWMAQTTFRDTQKLAVLDLHDGAVVWEQEMEDCWVFRGKLLENKILLYSFLYDKDTTNVTFLDFAKNDRQRETMLYEEELLASYIGITGENPVVLENDGKLYFEVLKFYENEIYSDICVWENGETRALALNCERMYCDGKNVYGLANRESGLCLYSLRDNQVSEKNLKIDERDMAQMTDFLFCKTIYIS